MSGREQDGHGVSTECGPSGGEVPRFCQTHSGKGVSVIEENAFSANGPSIARPLHRPSIAPQQYAEAMCFVFTRLLQDTWPPWLRYGDVQSLIEEEQEGEDEELVEVD